jgi:hypothetical protein
MQVVLRDESFGKIPIVELNDKLIRLGFKVRESMLVKTSSQTDLAFKIGKDQLSKNRLNKEKSIRVFCIYWKLRMD